MSRWAAAILAALTLCLALGGPAVGSATAATNRPFPGNGWVNPVGTAYDDWSFGQCNGDYVADRAHLGADSQGAPAGRAVKALAGGVVVGYATGWPGEAIGIEHRSPSSRFMAVYGHIATGLRPGATVSAGDTVGTVVDQGANSHLHLGVRPLSVGESGSSGMLRGTSGCPPATYGYTDPIPWLAAHAPGAAPAPEPDLDADGTPDNADACPSTAATTQVAEYAGCPRELREQLPVSGADANGDGRADFCRVAGDGSNGYLLCTLSAGDGFGGTYGSGGLDWGYASDRTWTDFDGDGKADFCRRVGSPTVSQVQCTLNTGSGFGATVTSPVLDWGYEAGRAWVDADGDGRSDFCRVAGGANFSDAYVLCTLSTGSGFGATIGSNMLDWGYVTGRAWTDANGDGKSDYCRRIGGPPADYRVQCTLSTGSAFGSAITSSSLDWGYETGRAWVDADGDGRSDFCRVAGGANFNDAYVLCTLSTGSGFGATIGSNMLDWGQPSGRAWVDANGDNKADYCRRAGSTNLTDAYVLCTLGTGTGFAGTISSENLDWGYEMGRAWTDANGDGKADYCRVGGGQGAGYVLCTLSTGTAFAGTLTSGTLDWGYPAGRSWPGFGPPARCRLFDPRARCASLPPITTPNPAPTPAPLPVETPAPVEGEATSPVVAGAPSATTPVASPPRCRLAKARVVRGSSSKIRASCDVAAKTRLTVRLARGTGRRAVVLKRKVTASRSGAIAVPTSSLAAATYRVRITMGSETLMDASVIVASARARRR